MKLLRLGISETTTSVYLTENLMQPARGDFNLAYKTEELDHLQSLFLIGFQLLFDFKKLKNREITSKCQIN